MAELLSEDTAELCQSKRDVRVPTWLLSLAISVLVAGAGIAIAIGQYEQRFTTIEHRQRELGQDAKQRDVKIASHDVAIAVLGDKLDTVIQQLTVVNSKLDRIDDDDRNLRR